jgi:hypothetical protein
VKLFGYAALRGGLAGASADLAGEIGVGIANHIEKKKAQKNTGLKFSIKDTNRPLFHVSIPDDALRASLYEAVCQIFEGDKPNNFVRIVPDKVKEYFRRPTKEEEDLRAARRAKDIEQKQKSQEKRKTRDQALKTAAIFCSALLALAGVVFLYAKSYGTTAFYEALSEPGKVSNSEGLICVLYRFGRDDVRERFGLVPTHVVTDAFVLKVPDGVSYAKDEIVFSKGDFVFESRGHLVDWQNITTDKPNAILPLGIADFPKVALMVPSEIADKISAVEYPRCNQFGTVVRR